jgi:hypothetical protein
MNRPGMGMATVMIKTIIKPASLMVETVVVLMLITSIAQSVNALKKVEGKVEKQQHTLFFQVTS